jgi:hypothetical protein
MLITLFNFWKIFFSPHQVIIEYKLTAQIAVLVPMLNAHASSVYLAMQLLWEGLDMVRCYKQNRASAAQTQTIRIIGA